jgi:hypothetical protein
MGKESKVEKAILRYLSYYPTSLISAWKNHQMGVPTKTGFRPGPTRGVSDILGIVKQRVGEREVGIFLAIEVKASSRGRLSPVQAQFIERIKALGGVAGVVTSVEETIQLLKDNFNGFETEAISEGVRPSSPE